MHEPTQASRKVDASHLSRNAYLYVRQSTLRQVLENTESTKRQYALRQRAIAMGWANEAIVVIDEDLGQSGADSNRTGFQHLVAEVGTGQAGIVMGLEVSRLARNSTDWHRLVEICALSQTLILDEDGIYDPGDFNDRLLLGLKGTMSEAELHMLRARLRGGIESLAKRGELRMPLPIGFVYDASGKVAIDPDARIAGAVQMLFDTFTRTGSGCATVKAFREQDIDFPRRLRRGPNKGAVLWAPLQHSRVLQILHNPRYAGAFAFGKTRTRKDMHGHTTQMRLPAEQWRIVLPDTHVGYISWERYQGNQRQLQKNSRSHGSDRRAGAPREGQALLQGLVMCGRCGQRMTVRYAHNARGAQPLYICQSSSIENAEPVCQHIRGADIDDRIGERVCELMSPLQLEVSLAVEQAVIEQVEQTEALHRKQVDQVRYEMELAQRRYLRVDPDNRLVADALEADWNAKLRELRDAEQRCERECKRARSTLDENQRQKVLALAQDFPRVWHDPRTSSRERKRLLRLLIADVTLARDQDEDFLVHVRFRGGATETLHVERPKKRWEQIQTDPEVVQLIDKLLDRLTDRQVAEQLNAAGRRSGAGRQFHAQMIARIRRDHELVCLHDRLRQRGLLTAEELAEQLQVERHTILIWRRRGLLRCHPYNDRNQYLYEQPGDELPRKGQHKRAAIQKLTSNVR